MTVGSGSDGAQGPRNAEGIAEFHSFVVAQVLFGNKVLSDVPVMHVAGKNEFALKLVRPGVPALRVGHIELGSVTWGFFLNAAGLVNVFIFEIQNGINAVLGRQRTEAVFQPPAGKDGAVSRAGLAFKIKFACPACSKAIFKFDIRGKV